PVGGIGPTALAEPLGGDARDRTGRGPVPEEAVRDGVGVPLQGPVELAAGPHGGAGWGRLRGWRWALVGRTRRGGRSARAEQGSVRRVRPAPVRGPVGAGHPPGVTGVWMLRAGW